MELEAKRVKTGGRQAGTPNKKTVILSELGINKYRDIAERLMIAWIELLDSEDITLKLIAMKELSKWVFQHEAFSNHAKKLTGEEVSYFD